MAWLILLSVFLYETQADCPLYGYQNSGADWTGLCASGLLQSPISIPVPTSLTPYNHYVFPSYLQIPAPAVQACNVTYSINFSPYGTLIIKDPSGQSLVYKPTSVAFHSPSEHMISGQQYPLEMQVYHSLYSGPTTFTVAALSLFFTDTSPTDLPFFSQFLNSTSGTLSATLSSFSLATVLNSTTVFQPYFFYQGSLTTPPCTEDVNWIVFQTPIPISSAQLSVFKQLWTGPSFPTGNSRLTQSLNKRTVYYQSWTKVGS